MTWDDVRAEVTRLAPDLPPGEAWPLVLSLLNSLESELTGLSAEATRLAETVRVVRTLAERDPGTDAPPPRADGAE